MNITVIGRRWFDKTYGNTYHSAEVYVDGQMIGRVPYEYGYGFQYEQTATEILKKNGFANAEPPLRLWAERSGHTVINSVTDVARKKDL